MVKTSDDRLQARFTALVEEGDLLFAWRARTKFVGDAERASCLAWMLSAVNLLEVVMPAGNRHLAEALRLLPKADAAIYTETVASIFGIFKSAATEWSHGLVHSLEFRYVGMAFEQFLEHATKLNADHKKMEAAVLASAVLEDTIKKLFRMHFPTAEYPATLDPQINGLKTKGLFTKVKAERLRSFAALRNQAFHANWDGFDEKDVQQMIDGLQEILETYLVPGPSAG